MDSLLNKPAISQDCLQYKIYLSDNQVESRAESICAFIHRFVSTFTEDYIWQKDEFNLRVIDRSTLHGETHFGDCIDDEWFITFLLVEITRNFKDTVVSVSDTDGEFLLIEAANVLPRWLDPSNATNRVWIHDGRLCIVKREVTEPDVPTALALVRARKAYVDDTFNNAALAPTKEYPSKARSQIHRTRAILPLEIAYILEQQPQLISFAVEAFYLRDPISLKACYKMQRFPPKDMISTVIKMTKTLYAQTVGQRFQPPKIFKMPSPSSGEYSAADIGMKLTCGFEMFMAQHAPKQQKRAEDDPQWNMFLANLTRLDYFGSEIIGSKRYNELLQSAKEQFLRNRNGSKINDNGIVAGAIDSLSQQMPLDWKPSKDLIEDSDDWLNVDEESLKATLESRGMNIDKDIARDDELNGAEDQLGEIAEKFDRFVSNEGAGMEGVEMEDEMEDEIDSDGSSDNDDSSDDAEERTLPTLWTESHDDESWGAKEKQRDAMNEPEFGYNDDDDSDASSLNLDMKDFIEFSRQALGLSEEQFREILKDREAQGKPMVVYDMPKRHPEEDLLRTSNPFKEVADSTPTNAKATAANAKPATNTSLDSFEAVMDAMDAELAKTRKLQRGFDKPERSEERDKGKGKESRAAPLTSLSAEASDQIVSASESDSSDEVEMDYNLLKNMLESIKGQAGGSFDGPAGNLMGRMGLKLP